MAAMDDLASILRRSAVFARVPARDLERLALSARLRRLKRGEFVCRSGDPAGSLFVVVSGRVSISRSGWEGGRRSTEFMAAGDVFGLPALASLTYPNDIQARAPSLVAALPKPEVLALVHRVPVLARTILEALAARLTFLETMLVLAGQPAGRRLASTLVYLREKFGRDVPLSRAEVAEMAGIAPETAMRLLRRFEDAGWVRRRPGGVAVVDEAALRREAVEL